MVFAVMGVFFAAVAATATAKEYLAIFELRQYRTDLTPGQDPLGRGGLFGSIWPRFRAYDPSSYSEEGRRRLKRVQTVKSIRTWALLGLWLVLMLWLLQDSLWPDAAGG